MAGRINRIAASVTLLVYSAIAIAAEPEKMPETLPVSQNQIVKLSEHGIAPQKLSMLKDDTFVFLYNDTKDALATIELDFGKKRTHCASSNLSVGNDGVIRSKRPFGPKDFAIVCFPERGTYDLTVYGMSNSPKGIKGRISVQ